MQNIIGPCLESLLSLFTKYNIDCLVNYKVKDLKYLSPIAQLATRKIPCVLYTVMSAKCVTRVFSAHVHTIL